MHMDAAREETNPSTDPCVEDVATPAASPGQDSASPRAPTPNPPQGPAPPVPHCLGARGYDGGFYDVGSFFVFRHEPQRLQQQQQKLTEGGADLELFGAAPSAAKAGISRPAPLHFELLDGLRVEGPAPLGGVLEMEGLGLEVAGRAFVLLERQVRLMGKTLGCPVAAVIPGASKMESEAAAGREEDEEGGALANGGAGGGSDGTAENGNGGGAVANGVLKKQAQPPRQQHDGHQEFFALSNTKDNDSLQGLVRSGGCLWIGKFGLPPVPPGEDETEMVDLWPRRVARLMEGGGGRVVPLEGSPDATGPLTAAKESGPQTGDSEALRSARRAHESLVHALAELRPHVPTPTAASAAKEGEEEEEEEEVYPSGVASSSSPRKHPAGGKAGPASVVAGGFNGAGGDIDAGTTETAISVRDSDGDTEEETSAAGGASHGGGVERRRRKRPRVEGAVGAGGGGAGGSYTLRGRRSEDNVDGKDNDFSEEEGDEDDEDEDEGEGGGSKGAPGAGEMTVAAVRGSLLRNLADEGMPNPEVEEWESVVKNFIEHVESLPPGPEQEELSLMFAAALDPTLVRMRAANAALVELAEACALPVAAAGAEKQHDSGGGGGAARKKSGFKALLRVEAGEGEDSPPPDGGISGISRAVAAAVAAAESAARAEACVIHAGDTLGGLRELKTDYKRTLLPGPREPIQFIIAEEQARVLGYVSAHEGILSQRIEDLRVVSAKIGDAYRDAEQEPGWSGVKGQVEAFLVEFQEYCESLLTTFKPESDILGVSLAGARKGAPPPPPAAPAAVVGMDLA